MLRRVIAWLLGSVFMYQARQPSSYPASLSGVLHFVVYFVLDLNLYARDIVGRGAL